MKVFLSWSQSDSSLNYIFYWSYDGLFWSSFYFCYWFYLLLISTPFIPLYVFSKTILMINVFFLFPSLLCFFIFSYDPHLRYCIWIQFLMHINKYSYSQFKLFMIRIHSDWWPSNLSFCRCVKGEIKFELKIKMFSK